eukprot:5278603-Ditylum_brightwellii.AAC.1
MLQGSKESTRRCCLICHNLPVVVKVLRNNKLIMQEKSFNKLLIVLTQKNVTEEPHGVAYVNAAVGDWKQRPTKATQATISSVKLQFLKMFLYQTQK